ncbi:Ser/Thr protein kinase [Corchorus capsularis]|uniref:Ser/Thr protein kinase n=1 Tax=Corchorus capsularis TaxID=210143 RepID=A0A1R3ICD8_COCAP|nr:Ser/Thr protein kinase [Corchorus capsularis]
MRGSVIVPISETAADNLEANPFTMNDALKGGFDLKWQVDNDQCKNCIDSEGVCGYNQTTNSFICFCRNQTSETTCPLTQGIVKALIRFFLKLFSLMERLVWFCCWGDDVPEITIREVTYRVLDINNNTRNLKLARTDYWDNICPQYLRNTTLISGLGPSSDTQDIALYYYCLPPRTSNPPSTIPLFTQFNCSINGTDNIIGYFMTRNITDPVFNGLETVISSSLGTCNNSVTVPVLKSQVPTVEANPNSDNLTQALRAGFDLQWSVNDASCESCLNSGGQCGQDINSAQFICYCTNGTFPNNCNGIPLTPEGNDSDPGNVEVFISLPCYKKQNLYSVFSIDSFTSRISMRKIHIHL